MSLFKSGKGQVAAASVWKQISENITTAQALRHPSFEKLLTHTFCRASTLTPEQNISSNMTQPLTVPISRVLPSMETCRGI